MKNTSKVVVHKSIDKTWIKWGVSVPGRDTRWFDSEAKALEYAKQMEETLAEVG